LRGVRGRCDGLRPAKRLVFMGFYALTPVNEIAQNLRRNQRDAANGLTNKNMMICMDIPYVSLFSYLRIA
jgi:hypothetical protein